MGRQEAITVVFAIAVFAGPLLVALALCLWARFHWFTGWFVGTMVLPGALWISEFFEPSGWIPVILMVWGVPCSALAAAGAVVGWVTVRRREDRAASEHPVDEPKVDSR